MSSSSLKYGILIGGVLTLIGITIFFAWQAYPSSGVDGVVFVPPAIHAANGHGFVNEVHHFQYPVPFFLVILRVLMPEATPFGAYLGTCLLTVVSLSLSAWVYTRAARWEGKSLTGFDVGVILLAVAGGMGLMGPQTFRPEIIAILVLLLAIAVYQLWPSRWPQGWLWATLGGFLGGMGAVHPNGALLAAGLLGMWISLKCQGKAWWRALLAVFLVPPLVFMVMIVLGPYQFVEVVQRLADVGVFVGVPTSADQIVPPLKEIAWYYLAGFPYGYTPLYGVVFLLGAGVFVAVRRQRGDKISSPWAFSGFLLLFGVVAYFTAIVTPERSYNVMMFAPLAFMGILYGVNHLSMPGEASRLFLRGLCVVLLLSTAAGTVRDVLMYPSYQQYGMTLTEARTAIDSLGVLDQSEPEVIAPWYITERYDRIMHCQEWEECEEVEWAVLMQRGSGRTVPPVQIDDFVLVHDLFVRHSPQFLGVGLGSMRGYSFAVYARPSAFLRDARFGRATRMRLRKHCYALEVDPGEQFGHIPVGAKSVQRGEE